jgi:hypothetical protein
MMRNAHINFTKDLITDTCQPQVPEDVRHRFVAHPEKKTSL